MTIAPPSLFSDAPHRLEARRVTFSSDVTEHADTGMARKFIVLRCNLIESVARR
jgi:hypothetical protein